MRESCYLVRRTAKILMEKMESEKGIKKQANSITGESSEVGKKSLGTEKGVHFRRAICCQIKYSMLS